MSTDLLSLDPLSFQSLGEEDVLELLYDPVFFFEEGRLKSNYIKNFKIGLNFIDFRKVQNHKTFEIHKAFKSLKESKLWSASLKSFIWKEDQILYQDQQGFFFKLFYLVNLLKLKGPEFGAYKVQDFKKAFYVKLKKNEDWFLKNKYFDYRPEVLIRKYKSTSTALDSILSGETDVFVSNQPLTKAEFFKYQKSIKMNFSKTDYYHLALYYKFKKGALDILKGYCENIKNLEKTFPAHWSLEKNRCHEISKFKSFKGAKKILLSVPFAQAFLDNLIENLKTQTGEKVYYEAPSALDLTEGLKSGKFDAYFSMEQSRENELHYFEAYHSKGRFNTFQIADLDLDQCLEEASKAKTLKDFMGKQKKISLLLEKLQPYYFKYRSPKVEHHLHPDSDLNPSKSSKRLMFR